MSRRRVLFLDCDGVLLDWVRPFVQWLGIDPTWCDTQPTYSLVSSGLFEDLEGFLVKLHEFEQTNLWGSLPPLGTMLALQDLVNAGFELQVVTALEVDAATAARRVRNLTYHYGNVFSGVHVVPTDKNEFIDKWAGFQPRGDDVEIVGLVEDNTSTLINSVDFGHRALGIKQPYNREAWKDRNIEWSPGIDALSFKLVTERMQEQGNWQKTT